jgi:hypothetical protein
MLCSYSERHTLLLRRLVGTVSHTPAKPRLANCPFSTYSTGDAQASEGHSPTAEGAESSLLSKVDELYFNCLSLKHKAADCRKPTKCW